jgi:hypothetical protein
VTQGHLIFAQNSDIDYVRQAYALALTIKKHNKINSVCLVTNDEIPEQYKSVFDHIIEIPFGDSSKKSLWKVENRWKLVYASPYDETMVYDSDMILLESNDSWWDLLHDNDIFLTSNVLDYKGNTIQDKILRKSFVANNLPNVYFGFHYFKKTKRAFEFYKWLEIIVKNYKEFYQKFSPKDTQQFLSMDVSAAIAVKILDAEKEFTLPTKKINFVHMKKELQGWQSFPSLWTKALMVNVTLDFDLIISNFVQEGLFHYTENEFLTDEIIDILEGSYE